MVKVACNAFIGNCFKISIRPVQGVLIKKKFMNSDKDKRPEAYPKPTETDNMMKNQDEYTERQSSRTSEQMPVQDEGKDPQTIKEADRNATDNR